MYGAGVAVVCSLIYGLILLAGVELGIVSIGVGYAVGKTVRAGTGGFGGRRRQVIAVVLTYLAISLSYLVPVARSSEVNGVSLIVVAIGLVVSYVVIQVQDGGSGLLSLLILAFGLFQAWKQTGRDPRVLSGPFESQPATLESGVPPVA